MARLLEFLDSSFNLSRAQKHKWARVEYNLFQFDFVIQIISIPSYKAAITYVTHLHV